MARILIILLINFLTLLNLHPECCCNMMESKNTNSKTSNNSIPLQKTANGKKTLKKPSYVNVNDKNMKNSTTKKQYNQYNKSNLTNKAHLKNNIDNVENDKVENNINKAKNNNGEHKKNVLKNNDKNEIIETYIDAINKYLFNLNDNEKIYGLDKEQFEEYYIDNIFLLELDRVASNMEKQSLNKKKIKNNDNILSLPEIETNKEITVKYHELLICKNSSGKENIKMHFSIRYRLNINNNYEVFFTSMHKENDLKFKQVLNNGILLFYDKYENPTKYFIEKIVKDLKDKNIIIEILEIKCEKAIFANNVEKEYNKIDANSKNLIDKTCDAIFTLIEKDNYIKQQFFKIFIKHLFEIYLNIDVDKLFKQYISEGDKKKNKNVELRDLEKDMIGDIPNLAVTDKRKLNK